MLLHALKCIFVLATFTYLSFPPPCCFVFKNVFSPILTSTINLLSGQFWPTYSVLEPFPTKFKNVFSCYENVQHCGNRMPLFRKLSLIF
jgi:hypothetical protein